MGGRSDDTGVIIDLLERILSVLEHLLAEVRDEEVR